MYANILEQKIMQRFHRISQKFKVEKKKALPTDDNKGSDIGNDI